MSVLASIEQKLTLLKLGRLRKWPCEAVEAWIAAGRPPVTAPATLN